MIQIDRQSDTPVHVQLEKRLRFMIANGDWRPGDLLPPTRRLADQLDISFHTVRKAYGTLSDEGLVESLPGKGYRVLDADPPSKSDRMERGAEVMGSALRELVSLGLDDDEEDPQQLELETEGDEPGDAAQGSADAEASDVQASDAEASDASAEEWSDAESSDAEASDAEATEDEDVERVDA